MLAYGAVAALSLHGLMVGGRPLPDAVDRRFRTTLLTAGAVMASCSGYFM